MKVQPRTRVIVCDGGRYVIYENIGDINHLDLRVVDHGSNNNPAAREQGDDRPGRYPSPNGQRSAVGQTDRHNLSEHRFVQDLTMKVAQWTAEDRDNQFILIADPKSIGLMRTAFPDGVGERVVCSIVGDYVQRPVEIIEELIAKA
jgi:protein required for attachment to host cells